MQILLHDIITQKPDASLSEDDQVNLKHMRSFYAACLDQDALDRRGSKPLLDIIDQVVALWRGRSTKPHRDFRSRLTDATLFLHSRAVPVLFDVALESDVKHDPSTMLAWIQQPELGLPDLAYFEDEEAVQIYQEVIRSSLRSVYDGIDERPIDRTPWNEVARDVVAFEKRLASALIGGVDAEDPNLTYNPHDSAALHELAPMLDWFRLFGGLSPGPRLPDPVIVAQPAYLHSMSRLVSLADEETLEAYLVWRATQQYGPLLGQKETPRKEVARLNGFLTGVEEGVRTSSESSCLASLIENNGNLVGRFYIQHAFSERAKQYGLEIIAAVVKAFKSRLPELSNWLDPATRAAAERKADAIIARIGYPASPNVTDAAAIRQFYSLNEPFDSQDYFGNVLRARMAGIRRLYDNVGGPRDLGHWNDVPSTVNAEYAPESNTISIPAGDMQTPYFDVDWPEYCAFGAFGSVAAGHELTHAFDATGRLYDERGKLADWWTNATAAKFDDLRACVERQYSAFYVVDKAGKRWHVNGRATNGEDVADLGGIGQSYRAWSDRFASDPDGQRYDNFLLPGIKLSREQLFFVSFARGWARNIREGEAVRRIRTDVHSPTWARVIGVLRNTPEFSTAFRCPIGSPMNPETKCKVW